MKKKYYVYPREELKERLPANEWTKDYGHIHGRPLLWKDTGEMDFLYGSIIDGVTYLDFIRYDISPDKSYYMSPSWLKELTLEEDPEYFL